MKVLTRTFFLSLVMVFTVFTASAQKKNKVSAAEKAKTETDGIVAALGLDETKAAALYDVNLEFAEKAAAQKKEFKKKQKAGEDVTKEDKKAASKEMRKAKTTALKAVLDKGQMDALKAYQKKMKEERKAARANKN